VSQLRESILDSTRLFFAAVDLAGRVELWNRAAEVITGYSHEQVQGTDQVWAMLLPDAQERGRLLGTAVPRPDEAAAELEFVIRTRDGAERVLSCLCRPLFGPTGERRGSLVMGWDVTALAQAEKALVESEAGFRALAENLPDGLGIVGADGCYRYVNRQGAELLGRTVEEMQGVPIRDILRPEDVAWVEDRLRQRIAGAAVPARYELNVVRRNGSELPVEVSAARIVWGGEPATMVLVRDTAERRDREKTLRETEELYTSLVRALPYAVTATDLAGTLTYVSAEALRMHGVARAENLLGRNALELIAPEEHARARANSERTLAGETLKGIEYTMLRRNGTRFQAELNATLMRDADGRPCGFLATVRELKQD
jgi:PAS domain S-box-containing protein